MACALPGSSVVLGTSVERPDVSALMDVEDTQPPDAVALGDVSRSASMGAKRQRSEDPEQAALLHQLRTQVLPERLPKALADQVKKVHNDLGAAAKAQVRTTQYVTKLEKELDLISKGRTPPGVHQLKHNEALQ